MNKGQHGVRAANARGKGIFRPSPIALAVCREPLEFNGGFKAEPNSAGTSEPLITPSTSKKIKMPHEENESLERAYGRISGEANSRT
jgi:hypothetical protein